MTNILALPLLLVSMETGTNESFRDAFAFTSAADLRGYQTALNVGNGTLADLSAEPAAEIADYTLQLTGPDTFRVLNPDGSVFGLGKVNVPFSDGGLAFTVIRGGVAFVPGDSFTLSVVPAPIDISGIRFRADVRRDLSTSSVLFSVDTSTGGLVSDGPSGLLGFAVPHTTMLTVPPSLPSAPYPFDIIARADGDQRRVVTGALTVVQGCTRRV